MTTTVHISATDPVRVVLIQPDGTRTEHTTGPEGDGLAIDLAEGEQIRIVAEVELPS